MGEVPGPESSINMDLVKQVWVSSSAAEQMTPQRIQREARTRRAFVCVRPEPRRNTTKGEMGPALILALTPVSSTPLRCDRSRRWRLLTILSDDCYEGLGLLLTTLLGRSRHLSHQERLAMRLRASQNIPAAYYSLLLGWACCLLRMSLPLTHGAAIILQGA